MPDELLTIKQAAVRTGKAEITVRRFVQKIVKSGDARRRSMVRPSPEEMQQHVGGPPPAWRINVKLLDEQFPQEREGSEAASAAFSSPTADAPLVEMLKLQNVTLENQLGVKDEQIKSLTELVYSMGNQLNERLRESNVLMKGLQERFTLPAATAEPPITVTPAKAKPQASAARKGSQRSDRPQPTVSKASKSAKSSGSRSTRKKSPRPGLLRRMFRS